MTKAKKPTGLRTPSGAGPAKKAKDPISELTLAPTPGHDKVGYGNPPRHAQFKPGQSGNPTGRPKKRPTMAEEIAKSLRKTTYVRDSAGRRKRMTRQQLIVEQATHGAAKGDVPMMKVLADLMKKFPQLELVEERRDLPAEHAAILERYLRVGGDEDSGEGEPDNDDVGDIDPDIED